MAQHVVSNRENMGSGFLARTRRQALLWPGWTGYSGQWVLVLDFRLSRNPDSSGLLIYPSWVLDTLGAPVAQWVKRWPTDLAVPGSILARGEIFPTVNGVSLHTAFHYHPPIVLIWLKHCWKGRKIASHPSIHLDPLEAEIFLTVHGTPLHTAFHYPSTCVTGQNASLYSFILY